MRTYFIAGLAAAIGWLMLPEELAAQGVYQAQTLGGDVPGNSTTNAIGWSFVPAANIAVTAISSSATQVSFWSSTSQTIATYDFTGPYGDATGPASAFQSIAPLYLLAGQTYYVSTENSDLSPFLDYTYGPPSGVPNGPVSFSTSAYLSQYDSYIIDSSGQWAPSTTPPDNADYLLLGPNFEFQLTPEPTTFELLALGLVVGYWGVRRGRFFPPKEQGIGGRSGS
jgi:hypothetical protein